MEDRFDLMEMAMDAMHGVILADVFPQIDQTLRHDPEAELLEHLPLDGVPQRLAVILSATRQHEELAFFGTDPHGEDLVAAQDDGPRGRADARRCAA
jgi:hypothetical protein